MCNDEQLFTKMETLKKPLEIVLGDGHVVKSHQQGTVSLMMKLPGNECRKCNLRDVLYVPNLSHNLVSVSKAVKAGKVVEFDGKQGQIKSVEGKLTAIVHELEIYTTWIATIAEKIPLTFQRNTIVRIFGIDGLAT